VQTQGRGGTVVRKKESNWSVNQGETNEDAVVMTNNSSRKNIAIMFRPASIHKGCVWLQKDMLLIGDFNNATKTLVRNSNEGEWWTTIFEDIRCK